MRSQISTLGRNERLKLLTSFGGNLSLGLLVAAVGRWFTVRFDVYILLWLAVSATILWTSWYALTMLEESDDG